LVHYGAPLDQLSVAELAEPGLIYQIGVPPQRIDIMTMIAGVSFEDAWPDRIIATDAETRTEYPVIGKAELIANKRAAARPQDLVDVENLERGC